MDEGVFFRYRRLARRLEGWLTLDAACFLDFCDGVQKREGIVGHIFEIGVHHGRTTVLLGLFVRPGNERLIVNDIFDLQHFNISTSGFGSEKIFLKNLRVSLPDLGCLSVIKKPSASLTLEETTEACRIFVIDGGHTAEETLSDLETARRAILPRGLIMVDDYANMEFAGVSEGICRFLQRREEIVPWAYCFNQMFLVSREQAAFYNDQLDSSAFRDFCRRHRYIGKRVRYFGRDMLLLRKVVGLSRLIHAAESLARKNPRAFEIIKSSPALSLLRSLYQKLYRPH